MTAGFYLFWVLACSLVREADGSWRAPMSDVGDEPCPFPFDPIQLVGMPLGQYHCPYCGSMVLAGLPHVDYTVPEAYVQ